MTILSVYKYHLGEGGDKNSKFREKILGSRGKWVTKLGLANLNHFTHISWLVIMSFCCSQVCTEISIHVVTTFRVFCENRFLGLLIIF